MLMKCISSSGIDKRYTKGGMDYFFPKGLIGGKFWMNLAICPFRIKINRIKNKSIIK